MKIEEAMKKLQEEFMERTWPTEQEQSNRSESFFFVRISISILFKEQMRHGQMRHEQMHPA
jgi:hypothetical protein